MIEAKKRKKKVSISEENISLILQRYTATTILTLLQEVAQFSGVKIDWNVLVKKTATGISNAREYQMLWRHLAYRDTLLEKVEDGIEPLDDDSDLETELEPSPAIGSEASTEAAACVKVLIASGSPSESGPANRATVEAPLTINIPNGQSTCVPLDNPQKARSAQGTNITIPVSVQKQPLPSVLSLEGLDGNGSANGNLPPRRKRKLWTQEEDMELIAAVEKCGEGNWANILKGHFKHDRTASQLSQRWAIIRKRKANLLTSSAGNLTGGALTEAQLAANQAVSLALKMPMKGSLSATPSIAAGGNSSTVPFTTSDASPVSAPPPEASTKAPVTISPQMLHQSQEAPNQTASSKAASASTSNPTPSKSRPTTKRNLAPAKSLPAGPNPLIQAAAVAAGARIANPSTAASLFKAAQSRNAVHIRQGGSVPQSSMPGARPMSTNTIGSLPPNVHFIRTGLASHSHTYTGTTMPSGSRPSSQGSGRLATVGQPSSMGFSTLSGQQVVLESKSSPTCGNPDSKRIPSVSTGAADISTASEDKHFGEMKLDGTEERDRDLVGNEASLMNSKVDGNQSVVDGDGGNINSIRRQTNAANPSPDENSSAVDKPMSPTKLEVGDKKVVGNNSNGKNAIAAASSSPNMEGCEDQIVMSKATENQVKLEVLPITGVGENLLPANAGHENQNVIDEQIGLPDRGFGGNQTGYDTVVVEKHTGSPNMESG